MTRTYREIPIYRENSTRHTDPPNARHSKRSGYRVAWRCDNRPTIPYEKNCSLACANTFGDENANQSVRMGKKKRKDFGSLRDSVRVEALCVSVFISRRGHKHAFAEIYDSRRTTARPRHRFVYICARNLRRDRQHPFRYT